MNNVIKCPVCSSELTYPENEFTVCSQCFHQWKPEEEKANVEAAEKVIDANGNELQNGDSVILVKDLPVKGAPKPLKTGTKVKNIRLNFNSDHNIDCKIDGYGAMALKSEFVRKA